MGNHGCAPAAAVAPADSRVIVARPPAPGVVTDTCRRQPEGAVVAHTVVVTIAFVAKTTGQGDNTQPLDSSRRRFQTAGFRYLAL